MSLVPTGEPNSTKSLAEISNLEFLRKIQILDLPMFISMYLCLFGKVTMENRSSSLLKLI